VESAVGSPPVLLLDDALSELDPDVQQLVLRQIHKQGQVFLTTAETAVAESSGGACWEVNGGMVAEVAGARSGVVA